MIHLTYLQATCEVTPWVYALGGSFCIYREQSEVTEMSIMQVEKLYKTYGEKVLFDHISFSVGDRQRIGLIGVNGTGKSSLLKVLAKVESPEEGTITHANHFRIEYLPQEPELRDDLTVLDQIYYGDSEVMRVLRDYEVALGELELDPMNESKQKRLATMGQRMDEKHAWDAITLAKTVLTKLGISDFGKRVGELSGGQRKRVAIARALIQPSDLLMLDEPTNHLDHEMIEWLESYLPQHRGAILFVTHDRYFLNRVANRILELDQGQLYSYDGNYEMFLAKKAEREETAQVQESRRQNLLRRELAWLHRGAKARTTKQKARIDRVVELRDRKQAAAQESVEIALGANRLGKKVIEVEGVAKRFAGRTLLSDFDYLVVPQERLGIIGPNGSGKTTLLNLLAGRVQPDAGSIEVGPTVKIGYYTQDHQELDGNQRVVEYIKDIAEHVQTTDGQSITAEQMLERFLFSRYMQHSYIRSLSGGERRRLYLLGVLMEEPNVLFLDEPTNDLDTQTLSILEEYLEDFPGVVITVSHDRYFLDRVVDHLLAFEGEGVIRRFQGNYSEYLELREGEKQAAAELKREQAQVSSSSASATKKDKPRKLSYKEQQEWDTIEERIASLEAKMSRLADDIVAAGSDSVRVQELYAEQERTEQELEAAVERWGELSEIVEQMEDAKRRG